MKKLLLGFMAMLLVSVAGATTIIGTLPYTITNGQPLDATPLMANFNWIVSQVNGNTFPVGIADGGTGSTTAANARAALGVAASGANSDITSLTGLTTPLSVAQGGTGSSTQVYLSLTGGTLTGSLTGTTITGSSLVSTGNTTVGGTLAVTGLLSANGGLSGDASCATNYISGSVNLCLYAYSPSPLAYSSSCTPYSVPTGAKTLIIGGYLRVNSENSVGLRGTQVVFYSDSGCSTLLQPSSFNAQSYEYVATAAGTAIATVDQMGLVRVNSASTIYYKYIAGTTTTGLGNLSVIGYFE